MDPQQTRMVSIASIHNDEVELIDRARRLTYQSRSTFIRQSAVERAQEILGNPEAQS